MGRKLVRWHVSLSISLLLLAFVLLLMLWSRLPLSFPVATITYVALAVGDDGDVPVVAVAAVVIDDDDDDDDEMCLLLLAATGAGLVYRPLFRRWSSFHGQYLPAHHQHSAGKRSPKSPLMAVGAAFFSFPDH